MFGKVYGAAIYGVDSVPVTVEADVSDGLPSFDMVGVLSSEVKEARERVRTALKNSGFRIPPKRITINLSPADMRKSGAGFDFPIAAAVLGALGLVPNDLLVHCMFCGELGLDGRLYSVPGVLPAAFTARKKGLRWIVVPQGNLEEAQLVEGIQAAGLRSLEEAADWLRHPGPMAGTVGFHACREPEAEWDFCDVNGQQTVKRAAEISAAGMHHLLCVGPPGAGKTMIARRLPGILPPMDEEEKLEVTRIYSVCGLLKDHGRLIQNRPFRAPHHTISAAALIGGGSIPRPGEITLAHRGVLFLDELPEFSRSSLESLRQPLEEKEIVVSRLQKTCRFPADFLLCAAMNPCKCGYYPDRNQCACTFHSVRQYRDKVSRPLLDRLDLIVEVACLDYDDWRADQEAESSAAIRKRVEAAHRIQSRRFQGLSIRFNGQMSGSQVKQFCALGREEEDFLKDVCRKMRLTPRSWNRILKVARTVADLDGGERIQAAHLSEAVFYRSAVEKYWGVEERY